MSQYPITVSVEDAKRLTGLGHTTVFELVRTGRLRATKVGGRRLIYYQSILDLLDSDTAAADVPQAARR